MLGQNSGMNPPHQKQGKVHFSMSPQTVFEVRRKNVTGLLKGCDSPWSDVPVRASIQVEDILSFFVNCDLINSNNWTVLKLGMFSVNVLCRLYVKYYRIQVFISEHNIPIEPKNHSFLDIRLCLYEPFVLCFAVTTSYLSPV
jgi:hypothetical protein